jgi:hypothetical protein
LKKDYALFLQDNHYYNRNSYLALIQKAHEKMVRSESDDRMHQQMHQKDLQLKIDHFFYAQNSKMVQEQLKYVAIAVRAEDTLKGHLKYLKERKDMRKTI